MTLLPNQPPPGRFSLDTEVGSELDHEMTFPEEVRA